MPTEPPDVVPDQVPTATVPVAGPESSTRIARVDVVPVRVPRHGTFTLQRGASDQHSYFAVVRVETTDGVVGWGECTTRVRSLHWILRDHWADLLPGRDPFDVVGIHRALDVEEMLAVERLGHWNPIRAAVDVALHDIQGKVTGVPLAELMGGRQRDTIETVKNVGVAGPEESADRAREYVEQGYRIVKLRVGTDVGLDTARVRAVREAIGDEIRIRIDANQAWDPTTAIRAIRAMDGYGLHDVEQPCPSWDVRGNAEVVAHVEPPVIADESVWTPHEAMQVLAARAADVIHLYIGKSGGLWPARQIVALAAAYGAQLSPGERVPLGIAEAAHLHLAATVPALDHPCALSYDLNEHDLLTESPTRSGGRIRVPTGPGLGVEVDEDKLAHYSREAGPLPWR